MRRTLLLILIIFILSLIEVYFVPELFSVRMTPLFVFSFLLSLLLSKYGDRTLYLGIVAGLFLDFIKMTTPGFTSFVYVLTLLLLALLYKRLIKNPAIIIILFAIITFLENTYIFLRTSPSLEIALGAAISAVAAVLWLIVLRKISWYVWRNLWSPAI